MKTALLVTAAITVAAVPAGAMADPPGGHGPSNPGGTHRHNDAGPNHGSSHKCAKPRRVAFVLRGTFASFVAQTGKVTINVVGGDRHAGDYLKGATTFTFDTTGANAPARVSFRGLTDTNADNAVGFDDATSADTVMVIGKLAVPKHGCPASTATPTLRKVVVRAPQPSGTS